MKTKLRLKRLIRSQKIGTLLENFAPLVSPQISLAVSDRDGDIVGSHGQIPPQLVTALLEAAGGEDGFLTIPQGAAVPICADGQQVGLVLAAWVPGSPTPPAPAEAVLAALKCALEHQAALAMERRAIAQETLDRYREINLLYRLGETLTTCLNTDELLQRTLAEAANIIQAGWGAIVLQDEDGALTIAARLGLTEELETAILKEQAPAEVVARTGTPRVIGDFRSGGQEVSLLAVPLHTSERQLGAVVLADKGEGEFFTAGDEKLLAALAWQAAIALENARLFDSVRNQRDEIAAMKHYMDNIFASIASGVITTDTREVITTFNSAAERILNIPAQQAVNHSYRKALNFLCNTPLPALIEDICSRRRSSVSREITPYLPRGERRHLNLNLSTLKGREGEILGVAIVMDDVTEERRYQNERAMFRRYLPPELLDQLPGDLTEISLRGERRVITVVFADIRGFTRFSEANPPERVVEVLNNYLALAGAATRFNRGIVDKYIGDAVMAIFNTPLLEEEEHAWRAVQTAWSLKEAVEAYHQYITPEKRLFVGIGICTGEAVVGNVGAEDRMEYTAIGDPVNLADQLQRVAKPGQILLCRKTWEWVKDRVMVTPLPPMQVKGSKTSTRIYQLMGLADQE